MIDIKRPIRLKAMIVDKSTGNIYIPLSHRPYNPGEIPSRLINDSNAYQDTGIPVKSVNVDHHPSDNTDRTIHPPVEYLTTAVETRTLEPDMPKADISKTKKQGT